MSWFDVVVEGSPQESFQEPLEHGHIRKDGFSKRPLDASDFKSNPLAICEIVAISGSFARGRCRRGRSEIPHFCSKLLLFALVLQQKQRKAKKNGKNA